jgi:hypothetical protein
MVYNSEVDYYAKYHSQEPETIPSKKTINQTDVEPNTALLLDLI